MLRGPNVFSTCPLSLTASQTTSPDSGALPLLVIRDLEGQLLLLDRGFAEDIGGVDGTGADQLRRHQNARLRMIPDG